MLRNKSVFAVQSCIEFFPVFEFIADPWVAQLVTQLQNCVAPDTPRVKNEVALVINVNEVKNCVEGIDGFVLPKCDVTPF